MRAYKLDSDADNFRGYLLASADDRAMLNEAYGKPIGKRWQPIRVEIERESKRRTPSGDFPCLFEGTSVVALSQRAVEALQDLLEPVGELLPVVCTAEPLWLYNCTRFADVLDEAGSDLTRFKDGGILHIRRHAWRPEVERETCFRLPQLHHSSTYATDTVVDRIRSAGLRGFLFQE